MDKLFTCAFLLVSLTTYSQPADTTKDEKWKSIYRATETRVNDLVHTKLDVRFDYNKAYMYGKAWITLHPHFYPTDSLNLDAKGMNINEVSVAKGGKRAPLKYSYDSINLRIILDKSYKANENYTVFINYVSKPNEVSRANPHCSCGLERFVFHKSEG
jgi:aminopeptidase N